MNGFWRKWLNGWCAVVALFGVVLAGGAAEATSGPVRALLDLLNGPEPLQIEGPMRFGLAVLGAVTIGWSLTLFAAIDAAMRLGPLGAPVWRMILASGLVWFVIDSALSLATGFGLNLIPNTIFIAGLIAPLAASGALDRGAVQALP
ncbi:MAG: hypothetical protein C0481_04295 [Phenylobacterium sp.]|uniref:hypothetical protein n=1 Tax=Phenylobacterium sp. TaxID=1871053 RepID=UPI0025EC03E1|nr:hypothetical protein [Phenylobacterium sp.]MBA4011066.1 hypothetical protein [Phenylobacterium sp.]